MRFIFLSDAHVADAIPAVQQRVIQWCRNTILPLKPDLIVLGGDLTHHPDPRQAATFLRELNLSEHPMLYLAGNNEGRDFSTPGPEFGQVRCARECEAVSPGVYALETFDRPSAEQSSARLLGAMAPQTPALVFAHFRPEMTGADILERLSCRSGDTHWVCGHGHRHVQRERGRLRIIETGGLDPVKVRAGRPDMLCIDWDGRTASVLHLAVPADILRPPQPRAFPIGLAFRGSAGELLATALDHAVSTIQFHYRLQRYTRAGGNRSGEALPRRHAGNLPIAAPAQLPATAGRT